MSGEIEDRLLVSTVDILYSNLRDTQIRLGLKIIKDANFLEEFEDFLSTYPHKHILKAMGEFCKLHPDVFFVADEKSGQASCVIFLNQGAIPTSGATDKDNHEL